MAVYLDSGRIPYRRMIMCHMIADSLPELHAMAGRIGLKREWFQPLSSPHYDVCVEKRALAIAAGARVVARWEFVTVLRQNRLNFGLEKV